VWEGGFKTTDADGDLSVSLVLESDSGLARAMSGMALKDGEYCAMSLRATA